MQLNVYLIRGRGEDGLKFQLAQVSNAEGHYYRGDKGDYDPTQQFASMDELKDVLAKMVDCAAADLEINELNL
ncbi:MAG: hypothetical protein OIF57_04365 [Marinobacterium sp.]|nr:hypothetical protein [Marinobacterium sp.]